MRQHNSLVEIKIDYKLCSHLKHNFIWVFFTPQHFFIFHSFFYSINIYFICSAQTDVITFKSNLFNCSVCSAKYTRVSTEWVSENHLLIWKRENMYSMIATDIHRVIITIKTSLMDLVTWESWSQKCCSLNVAKILYDKNGLKIFCP